MSIADFQIRYTIATSFDGTIEYRLAPMQVHDESAYRLTIERLNLYAPGSHEIVLPRERLAMLLRLIEHARIPMTAIGPMGLDGTTYTLEMQTGFTRLQCTWWLEVPEAWNAAGEIAREILRLAGTHPQEPTRHD